MSKQYFDQLPKKTQKIVADAITEAMEYCEIWNKPEIEALECRSRDGFIPYPHNHGGFEINGFTDLMSIYGSGNYPAHEGARKEIDRQIDYSVDCAKEDYCKLKGITLEYLNSIISGDDHKEREEYLDYQDEYLRGDDNSIMYQVRFMYHGVERGIHSASLSVAVNTEGPYHRSSISWAPNVFCEGAKEVEITWKIDSSLKAKLKKALDTLTKDVF
jgi:hypothetical protein